MFIDARTVAETQCFDTTVCIIGGGVAGIALALNFAEQQIDVCLLESGGFAADAATNDLYCGDNIGIPYAFDCNYRSRYLGGSSNCWGGWNRPLEELDFAARSWVPHSGWPIQRDEIAPFYERTHALLQLGPPTFDANFWGAAINHPRVRRAPLDGTRVIDSFTQFSPPARMGKAYQHTLETNPHIRVFLHANVVNIASNSNADNVTHVDVATLSGRRFAVRARYFVLATGGIENARLLLASNRVQSTGLGNGNDMVGRYFMDHPRLQTGIVKLQKPFRGNKLYDIKHQDKSRAVYAHNTSVAAQFVLTPETVAAEQLLHARVWLRSIFIGEDSASVAALHRFTQTYLHDAHMNLQPLPDLLTILREPLSAIGYTLARALPIPPLQQGIRYEIVSEPDPNPASLITLTTNKDALGLPRVAVDWRLSSLVRKTFERTLALVNAELVRAGVVDTVLPDQICPDDWDQHIEGTWHHMGTTRMHASAGHGVVDRDCKMHSVNNLYVAGSSVFPTGGGNFPTMTLAALALRLGDHLGRKIQSENNQEIKSDYGSEHIKHAACK
jgi:choline dehydrogenase-like flavoprotein